jgi:hypothetical protein
MLLIPLVAKPSQSLTIILGGQTTQLNLSQRAQGLFVDVLVNNEVVILGVVCQNQNRIVRYPYLNFIGDLVFFDTQGTDDPYYTGLGSRWLMAYISREELLTLGYVG